MEQLLRELRQCFRGLIRSPGFSLVVLLIISLGVGVNLIVFSALDSVALESLPYAEEDDLVVLKAKREGFPEEAITSAEYLYFRRYSQSFEMIGLIWDLRLTLTDGDRAEQVSAATVTSEVFQLLGVAAKTGRVFGREDFVGDESLAVISDELWRSRYSAAVEKVGSTIEINVRGTVPGKPICASTPGSISFGRYGNRARRMAGAYPGAALRPRSPCSPSRWSQLFGDHPGGH